MEPDTGSQCLCTTKTVDHPETRCSTDVRSGPWAPRDVERFACLQIRPTRTLANTDERLWLVKGSFRTPADGCEQLRTLPFCYHTHRGPGMPPLGLVAEVRRSAVSAIFDNSGALRQCLRSPIGPARPARSGQPHEPLLTNHEVASEFIKSITGSR